MTRNNYAAAAAICLLAGSGTSAAQADVKVVSKVDVRKGGASGTPISRTCTAYFKDNHARLDAGEGKVFLYDYANRKVYLLNTTQKIYFEKAMPAPGTKSEMVEQLSQFVSLEITGGIKAAPVKASQTIVGLPTNPYNVLVDVNVKPKQGGRFGGGAGSGMSVHVQGQFQGAAASSILSEVTEERLMVFAQQMMAGEGEAGPLLSDMMQLKVIPLKGTVTMTHAGGGGAAAAAGRLRGRGGAGSSMPVPSSGPTTISMEVTTLDKQASIEESLFQIPSDYQKTDPPKPGGGRFANR